MLYLSSPRFHGHRSPPIPPYKSPTPSVHSSSHQRFQRSCICLPHVSAHQRYYFDKAIAGGMENVEKKKKFPAGMRVLAIDDDRLSLMVLEKLLQRADYDVTAVQEPELALELLRARKEEGNQFHLVITDVHMPGIDGFKLLELINLEMDIPVVMLSANDELEMMAEGVKQGACDYMVKPIRLEQVKNLWLHVVKKGSKVSNNDAGKKLQPGDMDGENRCAKRTRKYTRKNKMDGPGTEVVHNAKTSTQKRRIRWSGELHRRFVEVVNRIGLDRAVPKKILKMMNVPGLGRENVASHLQKYRLYLQSVRLGTFKLSNPFANEAEWNRWNHINLKNGPEIYKHQPELGAQQPPQSFSGSPSASRNLIASTNTTSAFGMRSSLLPSTESVQPMSAQGNLVIGQNDMGVVGQGSSLLKDAVAQGLHEDGGQFISFGCSHIKMSGGTKLFHSGPSCRSIANTSDATEFDNTSKSSSSGSSDIMLADISNGSPSQVRNSDLYSYARVLRRKLLEASRGIPVDEDDDFQSIADAGMLAPTSLIPLQSPQLANQHSVQILPSFANLFDKTATEPTQFATLSISANNGEASVLPKFDDIGQNGGTFEGPSQENDLSLDQFLEHLATSISCQMPNIERESQNQQMGLVMSEEATPIVGFNYQQMASINLGSNNNSIVMPNDNCSLGASSTIYTVPNGEGASGNLPAGNDSAVPLQAVADELNNVNDEPVLAAGEAIAGDLLDDDFFIDFPDDFFTTNNAFMDGDLTFDL